MSEKTFERQAKLYCMMVENEHDKRFIMTQAQALDAAYDRLGKLINDQMTQAEHDLAVLTGANNAPTKTRSAAGEAGEKTAPVRDPGGV